jgi:1-acyl-sn-glycerol-3-phosphate acyltransferase
VEVSIDGLSDLAGTNGRTHSRVWRGKPRKIPTDEDEDREEEEERRIQRRIREILERFRRT